MPLYIGEAPAKPHKWRRRFMGLLLFIALAAGGLLALERYPIDAVPILEFHKVNDTTVDDWTIPTAVFEQYLAYLAEAGYQTTSVRYFIEAREGRFRLPPKPIVLTFDDGYRDFLTEAVPRMAKYDMTGTLYMVVNYIGLPKYLTWRDLLELYYLHGAELGSHTCNHRALVDLTRDEADEEVRNSYLLMKWHKLRFVKTLSYPEGQYDDRMPGLLAKHEYVAAVTGNCGYNDMTQNRWYLNRIYIPRPRTPWPVMELRFRLLRAKIYTLLGINYIPE